MNTTSPWYRRRNYPTRTFFQKLSAGLLGKAYLPVRRFGSDPDVGSTWETLSNVSGEHHYLSAAEQLKVVSDSAEDNPSGSGAAKVEIKGLLEDYTLCT